LGLEKYITGWPQENGPAPHAKRTTHRRTANQKQKKGEDQPKAQKPERKKEKTKFALKTEHTNFLQLAQVRALQENKTPKGYFKSLISIGGEEERKKKKRKNR